MLRIVHLLPVAIAFALLSACAEPEPLDPESVNPACAGYAGGYTERC
ncbi:hypothetical protein [Minwuia sp.]